MNDEISYKLEYQADNSQPRIAKVGWIILLVLSAFLILAGVGWFLMLPQMMSENIAEYANLEPGVLTEVLTEGISAFVVITIIGRGYGAGYALLGLMALLIALEGYRNGTRWAWMVMWVLVAAYIAIGGIFFMGGESYALSLPILFIALIAAVGLLLARKNIS